MKNPDFPHPKNYTPLSVLDGIGGDLFRPNEKNFSSRRDEGWEVKAWIGASEG